VDSEARKIPYVLSKEGKYSARTCRQSRYSRPWKWLHIIASGDSMSALAQLAELINIPVERVFAFADPFI
jgi:Cu+-exporting ATPase